MFEARIVSGDDMLLEVREDLLLQLELLGNGLDDEVDAVERGREVGSKRSSAPPAPFPSPPSRSSTRARELHARARLLELLLAHVVERDLHAGAREHGAHARAHRAGARSRRPS